MPIHTFPAYLGLPLIEKANMVHRHYEDVEGDRLINSRFNGWINPRDSSQIMMWNATRWIRPRALVFKKSAKWPSFFEMVLFDLNSTEPWMPRIVKIFSSSTTTDDYSHYEVFFFQAMFPDRVFITPKFFSTKNIHLPPSVLKYCWNSFQQNKMTQLEQILVEDRMDVDDDIEGPIIVFGDVNLIYRKEGGAWITDKHSYSYLELFEFFHLETEYKDLDSFCRAMMMTTLLNQ